MKSHKERLMQRDPSGERGVALILVMFMVMTMSLVGASLTFVSSNETALSPTWSRPGHK